MSESVDTLLAALKSRGYAKLSILPDKLFCQSVIDAIDTYPSSESEMHYALTEKRIWGLENSIKNIMDFKIYSEKILSLLFRKTVNCDKVLSYSNIPLPAGEEFDCLYRKRWHQDSLRSQYKVFLFLDSVTINSGPFQILSGSHKTINKLKSLFSGNVLKASDLLSSKRAYQSFNDSWIDNLYSNYSVESLISNKASAYVVNTSAIHRAAPCFSGTRYALCSYFRHF